MIPRVALRYSRVPWLLDSDDLREAGKPETTVDLGDGAEITHGLKVARPFGPNTDAMLAVHAVRATGEITLAITTVIRIDQQPVRAWTPSMDNRQSGANRSARTQADGFADDNGCNEPDDDA